MAKKGQTFNQYAVEFKLKMWQAGESFDVRSDNKSSPRVGRPRTIFNTVEEERDYLKAQVDYLKKRYPNLVKEKHPVKEIIMK